MDEINLCEIMNAFPECINNGSRLKAVLKDLYPDTPKAVINILGTMTRICFTLIFRLVSIRNYSVKRLN